jgi:hypothetical protein
MQKMLIHRITLTNNIGASMPICATVFAIALDIDSILSAAALTLQRSRLAILCAALAE